MGKLTTHILDTSFGKPAAGVYMELRRCDSTDAVLATDRSNADGRCNQPLLEGDAFIPGEYKLTFHIGDYFRALRVDLPEPPFLDKVVIRFGIAQADAHYHVPLLVSPWGYSTYRGS